MKIYTLAFCFATMFGVAACGNETVSHDVSTLPVKARTTIQQNFDAAITLVKTETEGIGDKEYEVTLSDGSEVTFNGAGEWENIERPANLAVPVGLIPTAITNFVNEKHAGALIIGIEKDKKGYDIDLSNGLEIQFDKTGNFVKYDK